MADYIQNLVRTLLDRSARIDERDDAAIDLGLCNDRRALDALLKVASNPDEESFIFDVCGESIASIWIRLDIFSYAEYCSLAPLAQQSARAYIEEERPDWVEKYKL